MRECSYTPHPIFDFAGVGERISKTSSFIGAVEEYPILVRKYLPLISSPEHTLNVEALSVPNMADVPENALYVWSGRPVELFLRKALHFRNRICIPEASTESPVERVIQMNIHFDPSTAERPWARQCRDGQPRRLEIIREFPGAPVSGSLYLKQIPIEVFHEGEDLVTLGHLQYLTAGFLTFRDKAVFVFNLNTVVVDVSPGSVEALQVRMNK